MDANTLTDRRMSLTLQGPRWPSVRLIATSVVKDMRKILIAMAAGLVVTCGVYLAVAPQYASSATLLVLLSSDYGYRPEVGNETQSPAVLEKEAFLKSEIEILTSPTLQREVIKRIGVGVLYPKYLAPPSLVSRLTATAKSGLLSVEAALGMQVKPMPAVTPDDMALSDFSRALSAAADKDGNIITVSFRHRDPVLAAQVVNTLVGLYLERRAALYQDAQASAVAEQVSGLRVQLDAAAQAYAAFKARTGISDYATQRGILLRQQGDLRQDEQLADSAVLQNQQRLTALDAQIARTPPEIVLYSDTDTATRIENLKTTLENLQVRADAMKQHYLDTSRPMAELNEQIRSGRAELDRVQGNSAPSIVRRGRNDLFDKLQFDRSHIVQDLQAAQARHQAAADGLAAVDASIRDLEANEVQLDRLDRERSLLDQNYRATTKALDDRRLLEGVDAKKVANIRIIQPADVPLKQTPLRMLILLAGLVFTLLLGPLVAFMSFVMRRGYITADALERHMGIPVLASIPDLHALGRQDARLRSATAIL
jgi:uncharacterized protein involved in exopolysaccharide biosynthesis